MSRTFRRLNTDHDKKWYVRDWVDTDCGFIRVKVDIQTDKYKKLSALYHSDKTKRFKEPGPAWFRLMFTEKPQRRNAKLQLYKYLHGEDIEVILNSKDPLDYWT